MSFGSVIAPFENRVDDYDSILFAIWFHDIIYNPNGTDNEEESAKYARAFLTGLEYAPQKIFIDYLAGFD